MTSRGIGICVLVTLSGLAGLSLFPTPTALGQKRTVPKPNFAGQWVLDKSKSTKGAVEDLTVLIQQEEPEIRITRRATNGSKERVDRLVYYSDARGETNTVSQATTAEEKTELKSVTKWDGNKLMIRSKAKMQSFGGGRSTVEPARIEKWQISKDGLLYWTTSYTFDGTGPIVEAMLKANILTPGEDIRRVFRRVQ